MRFTLSEKRLDYEMVYETLWDPSEDLFEYSPSGLIPVLVDLNGFSVHGFSAIREYLEEVYPEVNLLGNNLQQKAESRKISDWFSFVFYSDVYYPIIREKILKRFAKNTDKTPDPACVRRASAKLVSHMEYISWLIDRRNWLAGKDFSTADITAGSFISVLDYLGFIPWNKYDLVKNWYVRIKSRPSFRNILNDNLSQIPPIKDYANLDF